ncbi:MAG TPA: carboxypeptidase-like regulatory domain-containing protein, partial [Pedobacter sp.]|nr:carboxypeptidase-like regulatory domain-containing protein [Pedobacter sp.]
MKFAFLIVLITCVNVSANVFAQENVTIDLKKVQLDRALQVIEKKSSYRFVYSPTEGPFQKEVSISALNKPVTEILKQLLNGTNLSFSLENEGLITITKAGLVQKDITISGTVNDSAGLPMAGISVTVKGVKGLGTITDASGNFALKVPENSTIVFSAIGFQTIEMPKSAASRRRKNWPNASPCRSK